MEYQAAISSRSRMERGKMIQIRSVCLSAHLDSFCRRLNELRGVEFCYQTDDPGAMRRKVGWNLDASYTSEEISAENTERAKSCDLLIEMLRESELIEQRLKAGLPTVYVCERWFKPLVVRGFRLPGVLRLLIPSYRRMAKRFIAFMDNEHIWFFPCGVHAVRDFVRLYKILHGNIIAWFREPKIEIERDLCGNVVGFPRIKLWGYFVDPSINNQTIQKEHIDKINDSRGNDGSLCQSASAIKTDSFLRILWVGRMLDWKRVDILIKAFHQIVKKRKASLVLVGEGPERLKLEALAGDCRAEGLEWLPGKISFNNYIPSVKVRELMRAADIYVMPSNAEEGWGAAVSDALTEGCTVISTFEAGSSATLLPENNLYHSSSVKELANKLIHVEHIVGKLDMRNWSGIHAAERMLEIVKC